MATWKNRREGPEGSYFPSPHTRSLRVIAAGTLFQTHTLSVPNHPEPGAAVRAHSVEKTRGGSANLILSLLAQFVNVDAALIAPLGGNEEGKAVLKDLENEGVNTRYCKIWKDAGVPSAWVLHSDTGARSVINHNPLPDITHEDFISLLGPLLAPENYPPSNSPSSSPTAAHYGGSTASLHPTTPRPSQSGPRPTPTVPFLFNPNSPAPFDWLHFEGRSVKTTLSNVTGLDGLAREKKWRSHCVLSVDVGRRGRQGVEALLPHADVIFLNKQYAQSHSPHYASTPRTFLLSLASIAPAHALLVAHWGTEGSAVLSLPTKEYFQSSGWVEEKPSVQINVQHAEADDDTAANRSVRSGSDFWAGMRSQTPSSAAYTMGDYVSDPGHGYSLNSMKSMQSMNSYSQSLSQSHHVRHTPNASGQYTTTDYSRETYHDDESRQMARDGNGSTEVVDEVGAHDAFVAGMIYALSRKLCPGLPYTPASSGENTSSLSSENERGRWRLDECLRFATELSGRKARRKDWAGLADEMTQAGWFDSA